MLVQFSAAVALGNLKDPQAQAVLLEALDHPQVLLQEAAIAALGEIGAVEALTSLLRFADAKDWLIRKRLAEALGNLPGTQSRSALKFLQGDSNPSGTVLATAPSGTVLTQQSGYRSKAQARFAGQD